MTLLHGFGVVGTFAVLIGSVMQAASEFAARGRIIDDHNSYRELRRQVLRPLPPWAWRRRRDAIETLQREQVWTLDDQREYRRTMRSMRAWFLIIVGALYAVIVTIPSP